MSTTDPKETSGQTFDATSNIDEAPCYLATAMAFKESSENEDLDIYQMCAWISKHDVSNLDKATYYLKALCCWAIQVVGLMVFVVIQILDFRNSADFCRNMSSKESSSAIETKLLSVLFAFYVALKTGGSIHDINSTGCYTMNPWTGEDCPPFVSRRWVFFGLYTNVAVTLASIVGSFLVLYQSGDMLDAILNSVALFFVNDMDNFMLSKKDYKRIYDWFEEWKQSGEMAHPKLSATASCMTSMVFTPSAYCITYSCIVLSVLAPFWILLCQ